MNRKIRRPGRHAIRRLLFLGLISFPIGNFLFIDEKKTAMNIIEWNFALLLSGYYLLAWRAWLRVGPVQNVTDGT